MPHPPYRFEFAFSYAGPHRDKVRVIAEIVSARIDPGIADRSKGRVFFDQWFEHELLGYDMDVLLQRIFYEQSLMVVAELSGEYAGRPWCQVEARVIRDLRFVIDPARDETGRLRLLKVKFGEGNVPGEFQTTGYLDGTKQTPEQCAEVILKRHELLSERLANASASLPLESDKLNEVDFPSPTKAIGGFVNTLGMKLITVPAGTFWMGSPDDEQGRNPKDELRVRVRITKPFLIGAYEVTQAEYAKIMGQNPSYFSGGDAFGAVAEFDTTRFPVERVSWNDAVEFCRRLSEHPDEKQAGRIYRLPTEAEWEYACRAGSAGPFHFGYTNNGFNATCDGSRPYGTNTPGRCLRHPTEVGSFAPNGFGLHDTHGNVFEWCADWYAEGYYRVWKQESDQNRGQPCPDPQGPSNGQVRVIRGGSWQEFPAFTRSAYRNGADPWDKQSDVGFRVAAECRETKTA